MSHDRLAQEAVRGSCRREGRERGQDGQGEGGWIGGEGYDSWEFHMTEDSCPPAEPPFPMSQAQAESYTCPLSAMPEPTDNS